MGIKYRYIGSQTGGDYASLMGGVLDADFTIGRYVANANCLYFRWHNNVTLTAFQGLATSTDVHEITVANCVASLDGVPQISNLDSGAMGTIDRPVILGATWKNQSPYTALSGRYLHAEWYYATLYDSGHAALVNLVPALRGDTASPEAVFYDTVSGACFANAGTGTLAYSGDVTNTVARMSAASPLLYNGRTAAWTGRGNRLNVNDPLNWAVTNAMGAAEADGVPDSSTVVFLQGALNFTCSAERPLACRRVLFGDVTLADDCDWSGLANLQMDAGAPAVAEVEYIDAPCGSYIDTGFKPNQNSRVVMDMTVQGTYEYWFGVFKEYNVEAFAVGNAGNLVYSGYGNTGGSSGAYVAGGRHTIDFDKGVLKVDGIVHTIRSGQTFQLDRSIYLFLQNRPVGPYVETSLQGTLRCHSCRIYDNGTLVRDYVPACRDGVYGLYEKCSGTFAGSANATAFGGGAATGTTLGRVASYAGNIDLAGHKLTLPSSMFSAGAITDTAGGGELHLNVDRHYEFTTANMALSGALKLVKEGTGILVGTKAGQTYTGGTRVSGGWLKRGVNDRPFGAQGALITVEDGAAFDWCGGWENGGVSTAYDFSIAGSGPDGNGAIVSSVPCGTWNVGAIADLELAGDALIGGYGGWGFNYVDNTAAQKHTIAMNGHTLNIRVRGTGTQTDNTGVFHFRNVTTTGSGTIALIDCGATRAWVYPSFFTFGSDLSSVTFDLGEGYCTYWGVTVTVGTFIDRRSYGSQSLDLNADSATRALTVLDRFKPMKANLVRTVVLGDATHPAPVLDLGELDGPFALPAATYSMRAAAGATVRVDLGERKTSSSTPIISWTTPPDGVSFAWPDGVNGRGRLVTKEDGLYVVNGLMVIVR